ncbi:DNA/RNA non-specific endonuclease [Streptococcus zalophi]|uniref:DNA/RNA non-specific endonuclease n=1 Tax=Streptococcus zalophi TaxID=640031 RepID=UPI00215D1C15|nr:DNA/RNA non-specific endonuclease [Streptococcus zalophi]MCR8968290.1 DNA/RNA non-specific endonuclease [Streptococcus zalophi]
MKKKLFKKLIFSAVILLTSYSSIALPVNNQHYVLDSNIVKADQYHETVKGTLEFKKEFQLSLGKLDDKGRATSAHIQLRDQDEPTKKRKKKLEYNPAGWHNYKFYFGNGEKKAWLMNRGHLIGYQFSGLNDEAKNLVPMTAWVNSGNYKGTDKNNQDSMLFYEKRLDSWLATHPNYWLDYKVTPIYQGDELIPRQIELQYVGIDKDGKLLEINIGGKSTKDNYGISKVVLENTSPNATIDYVTGTAQNTVLSAKEQKVAAQKAEEERRLAEEAQRLEQERIAAEEAQRLEQERIAAEQAQRAEQERIAAEEAQRAEQERIPAEQAQAASQGGYFRDNRGRWHRPNGQYASKAEIAAAGLPW